MIHPVTLTYTVEDVARALWLTDKDVRRALRRLRVRAYRGQYQWDTPHEFHTICQKIKTVATSSWRSFDRGRTAGAK
jgi:hypothetical protein